MAIPTYDKFYRAVLETLSDGEAHSSKEIINHCADFFHLTEEERSELLQSGRKTKLANRVGWARTYLKKAGLIRNPSWGRSQITAAGKTALSDPERIIDNRYLSQFKGYQDFVGLRETADSSDLAQEVKNSISKTPQEIMESAYNDINEQLADELLANIMDQSPAFFERLVIDLLENMGYGGELIHPGQVTGKTGDEGIDGVIREDTLGFDKIYVQAKRWSNDHSVGEPDIQQFAGALMGRGATKGLFITTSHFSKQAIRYVERHMSAKIVLVDGETLTKLMIRYNIGVSTIHTFEIKRVDTDYFNSDDE